MNAVRPQYHLRPTGRGFDAFDVRRLIALSAALPVRMVDPRDFAELDEDHWFRHSRQRPTPRRVLEHARLMRDCDLAFPIILDAEGRVMDGMHRICRALLDDVSRIPAVRFETDPEPDLVDCDPVDLPGLD